MFTATAPHFFISSNITLGGHATMTVWMVAWLNEDIILGENLLERFCCFLKSGKGSSCHNGSTIPLFIITINYYILFYSSLKYFIFLPFTFLPLSVCIGCLVTKHLRYIWITAEDSESRTTTSSVYSHRCCSVAWYDTPHSLHYSSKFYNYCQSLFRLLSRFLGWRECHIVVNNSEALGLPTSTNSKFISVFWNWCKITDFLPLTT